MAAAAPDLVIHLGDLSLDGARDPAGLTYGRRLLDQLPVPWRAVPGNHDIGDNPQPGGPDGLAAEAGQWSWLQDQVSQTPGDRQVALLSHRPLAAPEAELAPALPPRRSSSSRTGWPS